MIYLDTSVALAELFAEEPFPAPVPPLDALHLATLQYLSTAGQKVALATFDDRMRRAARALGLGIAF